MQFGGVSPKVSPAVWCYQSFQGLPQAYCEGVQKIVHDHEKAYPHHQENQKNASSPNHHQEKNDYPDCGGDAKDDALPHLSPDHDQKVGL
jgi:hypothetical protein